MVPSIALPVEEYLNTAYEPDCEYIDGEVIERHVGELPHGDLQGALYAYFRQRRKQWNVYPLLEQRIQIHENKFLIPDVCVVQGPKPGVHILAEPPLIWIEILSPQDRYVRVEKKVRDALEFGSAYVWVINPETLDSTVWTRSAQYQLTDGIFRIANLGIVVPLKELEED